MNLRSVNLCSSAAQDIATKLENLEFLLLACQEIFNSKASDREEFSTNTSQEAEEACRIPCSVCDYIVKVDACCRWWLDSHSYQ